MIKKSIKIGNKIIGGSSTFIIADIGSNHMQDISLAKESILAAVESGVDAVKFQSIQLDKLYFNPDSQTSNFVKKLEFPEHWHQELNNFCKKLKITFFSSPTYLDAIRLLEEIEVPLYKIASAQIGVFPQLIERVAALNKPTLFSTGIINNVELESVINIFKKNNNSKYIILHCNSIYPTPPEKVNLSMIQHYIDKYPKQNIGFSDHTVGTNIAKAAVAMGAEVIEKHFTLNKKFDAPDSNDFACDPREMKKLCKEIREIDLAKKRHISRKNIELDEARFKSSITTRLVLNKKVKKGNLVKEEDFIFLRAANGVNCTEIDNLIQSKTKYSKDINNKRPLNESDISY